MCFSWLLSTKGVSMLLTRLEDTTCLQMSPLKKLPFSTSFTCPITWSTNVSSSWTPYMDPSQATSPTSLSSLLHRLTLLTNMRHTQSYLVLCHMESPLLPVRHLQIYVQQFQLPEILIIFIFVWVITSYLLFTFPLFHPYHLSPFLKISMKHLIALDGNKPWLLKYRLLKAMAHGN